MQVSVVAGSQQPMQARLDPAAKHGELDESRYKAFRDNRREKSVTIRLFKEELMWAARKGDGAYLRGLLDLVVEDSDQASEEAAKQAWWKLYDDKDREKDHGAAMEKLDKARAILLELFDGAFSKEDPMFTTCPKVRQPRERYMIHTSDCNIRT
jgi:hypothetical protein